MYKNIIFATSLHHFEENVMFLPGNKTLKVEIPILRYIKKMGNNEVWNYLYWD